MQRRHAERHIPTVMYLFDLSEVCNVQCKPAIAVLINSTSTVIRYCVVLTVQVRCTTEVSSKQSMWCCCTACTVLCIDFTVPFAILHFPLVSVQSRVMKTVISVIIHYIFYVCPDLNVASAVVLLPLWSAVVFFKHIVSI